MKINVLLTRTRKNWAAKVLSLSAAVVLVLLYNYSRLETRDLSVPLRLELPAGYVPAAPYADRVRLSLRGEPDEIFRLSEQDLDVFADFREHRSEGSFRVPVQVQKLGAALSIDPLEISVDPLHVTVRIGQEISKELDVVPRLSGYPPPGFQLGNYVINPPTLTVTGPREHVEGLESLSTEEIDISGRTEDFLAHVPVQRPNQLVRIPSGDVVEFRASIEDSVVLTTFDQLEIVVLNLSTNLRIVGDLPTGSIRIQGAGQDIEELAASDLQLIVDASDITTPGVYSLPIRPMLPVGFLVLRYEPGEIELEIVE